MSIERPFGSNTLPTFVYEPFSYTISNPSPGTYTLTLSNVSSGIPPGYLVNNDSNVVFSTSSNGMGVGSESFTVVASSGGSVVSTSSNIVTVGAGRFLDASGGSSYVGSNFTFYKNEPIPPIPLVAPFAITVPTSVPSLPPGLTFTSNASNSFSVTGTPLVTVPQSNYLLIGKATGSNLGKIVTSQFALSSSNERVILDLSGTPIVSSMEIGTAISPRILTARFPPYPSGGTLRYNWPGLPDGLVVTNSADVVQPPTSFTPVDASSTLIISGTPTLAAANAFRDANISNTTVTFTGTRTSPLPQISNSQAITFGFAETVLFDTTVVPTLYTGVALDPSATSFRAQTYFGTGSAISSIFSPDLRADLSLSFVGGGRAYLTGTPDSSTGTASYTVRAINSNAISRDLSVPITVAADTVSFVSPPTPAVDICYNFVLSRPSSLALSGYYPSTIQFQATAASGKPVTFSASALSGTGLSLSNVSANVVQVVGIPTTVTPLTTVTVTASAVGTPATASRTFKLAVVNDVITISDVSASSLAFVQNRAITPIQLSATTLSERPVISFTSTDVPAGLSLSTTGLLTGTPTGFTVTPPETFTVSASTGYASQTKTFTFNTVQDNAIIVIPTTTNVVTMPTFSDAEFEILTYSGSEGTLNNIPLTPLSKIGAGAVQPVQAFDVSLTWSGSMLVANFSSNAVLAPEYRFLINGTVGALSQYTQVNMVVNNPPTVQHTAIAASDLVLPIPGSITPPIPTVTGAISVATDSPVSFPGLQGTAPVASGPKIWTPTYSFSNIEGNGYDLARNSNVMVAVLGSNILRSTDYGNTWTGIPSSNIQTLSYVYGPLYSGNPYVDPGGGWTRRRLTNPVFGAIATDGGSNWWAIGEGSVNIPTAFPIPGPDAWVPMAVVRTSTDNGLTWVDVSATGYSPGLWVPGATTTGINAVWMQKAKLSYNQGRLFYTGIPSAIIVGSNTGLFTADVSTLSVWTDASGVTVANSTGIAFSNSTALAVISNASYQSSNNGATWTSNGYGGTDVIQKYGLWGMVGYGFTRDLNTWDTVFGFGGGDAVAENGVTWVFGGSSGWQGSLWLTPSTPPYSNVPGFASNFTATVDICAGVYLKRLYTDVLSNPTTTATMYIPYDASGIAFTSPLQTQYTNWQFVPIPTIDVVASNPVPGSFMYYYASGLPRGLQINLDASGIESSITGTSSQYSDAFQRVVLYAALNPGGGGGGVAALPITMRTILPTVQKQQTSAGSWTSLVRQYTVVNAAQNSLNGKTLPATEPPLGEFTRPEPPDVVSATGDPNCVKKC